MFYIRLIVPTNPLGQMTSNENRGTSTILSLALGHGHGKYAQWINARHGLSGHLWQGRFFSTALDEEHLWAAARYVELPVFHILPTVLGKPGKPPPAFPQFHSLGDGY